jgi:hypothetical protein
MFRNDSCSTVRDSIVVSISACHADDPGSIPGRGVLFCASTRECESATNKRGTKITIQRWSDARLAQSVERKALNLVVVGSSPTVGDLFGAIWS